MVDEDLIELVELQGGREQVLRAGTRTGQNLLPVSLENRKSRRLSSEPPCRCLDGAFLAKSHLCVFWGVRNECRKTGCSKPGQIVKNAKGYVDCCLSCLAALRP